MKTPPACSVAATRAPGAGPRPNSDFYPTPPALTRALLSVLALPVGTLVHEPAAGDGAIATVLRDRGYRVIASDLLDHGAAPAMQIATGVDFLRLHHRRASALITNPPYSLAEPFLRQTLGLGYETVALLLPMGFLAAATRRDVTTAGPLAQVFVLQPRPTLYPASHPGGNSGVVHYAWMVWRVRRRGAITLAGLDWRPFAGDGG